MRGLVLAAMREYREGKRSLGTLASRLGLSVSEAVDALAELGVTSPIEYEEYLEGSATARSLVVPDGEPCGKRGARMFHVRPSNGVRGEKAPRA
jgi:hypothetical protein